MVDQSGKTNNEDITLVERAIAGDRKALEELIKQHQDWIFNVALSFVADSNDAADITQEVLVKIVTKLSTFKKESNIRTWIYRIIKNHFLNRKRSRYETVPMSFEQFGNSLDNMKEEDLSGQQFAVEEKLLVEEAKLSCMKAMLLCLDREQRLIFIIGELFEISDIIGSEIMEMSRENFRIKLHRAKQQLYTFMDNKCGLINSNNPCRCARKTVSFVKMGFVDPVNLNFQKEVITTIGIAAGNKLQTLDDDIMVDYRELYRSHPFLKGPQNLEAIRQLLSSDKLRKTFNLDDSNRKMSPPRPKSD